MDRLQNSFMSIDQVQDLYLNREGQNKKTENTNDLSFRQILEKTQESQCETQGVNFSKHASDRLTSRNINLNEEQLRRLNEAVRQAKEKSIQESLVMMDNIAFIVNVKNNTVITAIDQVMNESNVFTNIDGAVIV